VEPLAEPIRQSVFDRQGYDTMMNLLALQADARPEVLSDSEESINTRATIFEEYANGGLEILQDELRGARDVLESVVLLISSQRQPRDDGGGVFDLSKLVK
jgi:dnd system-associated protein 4